MKDETHEYDLKRLQEILEKVEPVVGKITCEHDTELFYADDLEEDEDPTLFYKLKLRYDNGLILELDDYIEGMIDDVLEESDIIEYKETVHNQLLISVKQQEENV